MSKVSLKAIYDSQVESQEVQSDPNQLEAITQLQTILDKLISKHFGLSYLKKRLMKKMSLPMKPTKGLYLWGSVGRGKTYLMDLFYEALPLPHKKRQHFHRFMYEVHQLLHALKGTPNPLEEIANHFSADTDVLCFDEFFVSDIADAMILGTLLQKLFQRGITVIATSNIAPQDLYHNGLQRDKFFPAIEAIEKHMTVCHLDSDTDYRFRTLRKAQIYHYPLAPQANESLEQYFKALAPEEGKLDQPLMILERSIPTKQIADSIVWFEFKVLCQTPRSQNDYIEISKLFATIILSDVKVMGKKDEDTARRFIAMVDEFYERNVALIISASHPPENLYQGRLLKFEFKRTLSRLTEMMSHEYLAKPHLP